MNARNQTKVPEPSLKRLPLYLHLLKKAAKSGVLSISAPLIAKELELDPTQVVKDLSFTGASGRPRIGYRIDELILAIERFLGFDHASEAILLGAGHLGTALMSYPDFEQYGLKIVAAFDSDSSKLGRTSSGINVIHIKKLREIIQRLGVEIAVLTTPGQVAQEMSEQLVSCGIRAIWNLTPVKLKLPREVVVQDTSMYANVALLLNKLKHST